MRDEDWDTLLKRIYAGKCTPFLGAKVCGDILPDAQALSVAWAKQHNYPLKDSHDLARVAQFIAVHRRDNMIPREELAARFQGCGPPDFTRPDEPHAVLASLPLPVYITTNYDDFMIQALKAAGKTARRDICRWNDAPNVQAAHSVFDTEGGFTPTAQSPLVFHLHGHLELLESMVLTEDDYFDFLVSISRQTEIIPPTIQQCLAATTLMFIGYRLADWDFRVLHRGLVFRADAVQRRISVAVQLPRDSREEREYLNRYFDQMSVVVYWGSAESFASDLSSRWSEFLRGRESEPAMHASSDT